MELKEVVKEKYGQAALRVNAGGSSCCGAGAALDGCCDPITSNLYDAAQTGELPEEAVLASLGCGNPDGARATQRRVKRCSIWAPAAVSTCCFPRGASAPPAKPTASI